MRCSDDEEEGRNGERGEELGGREGRSGEGEGKGRGRSPTQVKRDEIIPVFQPVYTHVHVFQKHS